MHCTDGRWHYFVPSVNPGFVCGRVITGRVATCCQVQSSTPGSAATDLGASGKWRLLKGSTYMLSWGAHPLNLPVDIALMHKDTAWHAAMPLAMRVTSSPVPWAISGDSKAKPTPARGYRLQVCPSALNATARNVAGACVSSELFDIGQ